LGAIRDETKRAYDPGWRKKSAADNGWQYTMMDANSPLTMNPVYNNYTLT
jgi:hypothetical protein